MTTDHPLGDINGTDAPSPAPDVHSIVDEILNLDDFLSGDVRRAEKVVRICTRPDLEGDIDQLEAELATLVDSNGNPLEIDESLGDGTARTAVVVAMEIEDLQQEMAASMRSIRLRAMPEPEWAAFRETHLKDRDEGVSDAVWDLMIVACAVAPTISAEQITGMRQRLGHPQIDVIATGAWNVNTKAGVSIPKSSLSSVVLRRARRSQS
jgi:hypothetical protein